MASNSDLLAPGTARSFVTKAPLSQVREEESFFEEGGSTPEPKTESKGLLLTYCNLMINQRYRIYSRALEYFGDYNSKIDPKIKIELGIFSVTLGFLGFIVSPYHLDSKGVPAWSDKRLFPHCLSLRLHAYGSTKLLEGQKGRRDLLLASATQAVAAELVLFRPAFGALHHQEYYEVCEQPHVALHGLRDQGESEAAARQAQTEEPNQLGNVQSHLQERYTEQHPKEVPLFLGT